MSITSSGLTSKSEKSKATKYAAIDINSIYQGASPGKPKQTGLSYCVYIL